MRVNSSTLQRNASAWGRAHVYNQYTRTAFQCMYFLSRRAYSAHIVCAMPKLLCSGNHPLLTYCDENNAIT